MSIPGGMKIPRLHYARELSIDGEDGYTEVPTDDLNDDKKKAFLKRQEPLYVKLHGSYGWKTNKGDPIVIVGTNKTKRMDRFPILKWQLELFEKVLNQGNMKLLVIGYGFMDEHINKRIFEAISNKELRLFILSTQGIKEWNDICNCMNNYKVFPGLSGYFNYSLADVFSGEFVGKPSPHLKSLYESFFGES